MPLHVDQRFAFLAKDQDGDEGVIAFPYGDGVMPCVAADEARVASLRQIAQQIANARGTDVTLAVFSVREDRETLRPTAYKPRG